MRQRATAADCDWPQEGDPGCEGTRWIGLAVDDEGAEFGGEGFELRGGGGVGRGRVVLLELAGKVGAAGEAECSEDAGQLVRGRGGGGALAGRKSVCGEGGVGGFKCAEALIHLRAELKPHAVERACQVGLLWRGHLV